MQENKIAPDIKLS